MGHERWVVVFVGRRMSGAHGSSETQGLVLRRALRRSVAFRRMSVEQRVGSIGRVRKTAAVGARSSRRRWTARDRTAAGFPSVV